MCFLRMVIFSGKDGCVLFEKSLNLYLRNCVNFLSLFAEIFKKKVGRFFESFWEDFRDLIGSLRFQKVFEEIFSLQFLSILPFTSFSTNLRSLILSSM